MPAEVKYMNRKNWSDIERQCMFEAIVMFAPERPLGFFVPDREEPTRGSLVQSVGDFQPGQVNQAVVSLKTRKSEYWYQLLVEDQHPFWVYLPQAVTGRECFVDLTEITTIHKNMLLTKKRHLPDERMARVDAMVQNCLGLGMNRKKEHHADESVS